MSQNPNRWHVSLAIALAFSAALLFSCSRGGPKPGAVLDEALSANRSASSFPAADEDYFHDMDGGLALSPDEVKGRNTWIVWAAGNDRFWDSISKSSVGTLDFLKTVSSHPTLKFSRDNRWNYLGLVNEPCFQKATAPDPQRFNLWLDKRVASADCPADPFENESKYPGVKIGARGKNLSVGSAYGWGTGIVGLRLFPNPDFDDKAEKEWNAERFYTDEKYYNNKNLVKPFRVGMSCGFCHVGPNPLKPPSDPEHPKWENLSSNVGAQYFWIDRIFAWQSDPGSFAFQLFHTSRPGALDTSLVSTDNINNPRTMNAVYSLGPRLARAKHRDWGQETLSGGGLDNKQLNDYVPASDPLAQFYKSPNTVWTTHVLKDGSDSVGPLGALNRVFLNIGLFSEEWLLHFNALVGGKPTTPIKIADARKNSVYWQVTEAQTPDLARFFLKSATPHHLKDAPGGEAILKTDVDGTPIAPQAYAGMLGKGKEVFAERCARCHSSKLPEPTEANLDLANCAGKDYLNCWSRYWSWTKTPQFKQEMRKLVLAPDFLEDNYLSTEARVPVTLLQTNACSPLASNAIGGSIWDNFSSQSYKDLPSVGTITWFHPVTGERKTFQMPAGGRGYTRPASLISVWSTAPFLLNNTVGKFNPSPSVTARIDSFNDSIQKMLWPERREKDSRLGDKGVGLIDRTTHRSYLRVPSGYLPEFLQSLGSAGTRVAPWLFGDSGIEIGPIPQGAPVSLLANLAILPAPGSSTGDRIEHDRKVLSLLLRAKHDLKAAEGADDEEARRVFGNLVDPLLELSNCPDLVVNRGHYFGTSFLQDQDEPGLSDSDKRALITFLKTF